MMTVECKGIVELLDSGYVELLPVEYCKVYNDWISENLPWSEHSFDRLDWDKYKGKYKQYIFRDHEYAVEPFADFLQQTCLYKHEYLGVIYSLRHPGVVVPTKDFPMQAKMITMTHSPMSFVVGLSKDKWGLYEFHYNDFAEIYGFKTQFTVPDYD